MKVFLPYCFDRNSMYSFISEIIHENNLPKSDSIDLSFERLRFIKPSGITILHNIIQWLLRQNVRVIFITPNNPEQFTVKHPIRFLDDTGFFHLYLGKKLISASGLRDTTIPLKNVTCEESYVWLENTVIVWLMNCLGYTNSTGFSGVKTCIGEIFNNIKDHSGENIGCAFAQYYPQHKNIEIAISDFGVGIPCRMRERYHFENDAQALELAIKEGYTTQSYPGNRGAGLDHLIKIVVENFRGSVYIHSNKGIINCLPENGLNISSENTRWFYPGTLILIKFRTDYIYEEPYEEDFSW